MADSIGGGGSNVGGRSRLAKWSLAALFGVLGFLLFAPAFVTIGGAGFSATPGSVTVPAVTARCRALVPVAGDPIYWSSALPDEVRRTLDEAFADTELAAEVAARLRSEYRVNALQACNERRQTYLSLLILVGLAISTVYLSTTPRRREGGDRS